MGAIPPVLFERLGIQMDFKKFIEDYFRRHAGRPVKVHIQDDIVREGVQMEMVIKYERKGEKKIPRELVVSRKSFKLYKNIRKLKVAILHEIGHLKTFSRKIAESEYLAQKWAIQRAQSIGANRIAMMLHEEIYKWAHPFYFNWNSGPRAYRMALRIAIKDGLCKGKWTKTRNGYKLIKASVV